MEQEIINEPIFYMQYISYIPPNMDSTITIDQIIDIPTDHTLSSVVDSLSPPPPTKSSQKMIFKIAVPAIFVTASGIANLPLELPAESFNKLFSEVYIFVVFICFSFGMGLLLFSVGLPHGPISVSLAKKLMWVLLAVVRIWPLEHF